MRTKTSARLPMPSSNTSIDSLKEEGSADSGRATGGLTSCSPFESAYADLGITPGATPYAGLFIYEFEIPNTLVGLIIGVKGKTIKELCSRTGVKMLIRPHHTPHKFDSHQICSVEGKREHINKCLHLIRHRFPQERFPDLNLKPVLPPPIPPPVALGCLGAGAVGGSGPMGSGSANGQAPRPQPTPLTLPVGVPCEVYISAPVDAGHFFVQLPTHPTFQSLQILDFYMMQIYSSQMNVPELPKPCRVGVLCAAPAYNGWFRAITLNYDEEQDEAMVKFVDYGGFARLPRADLRQIRTDFMTLPLQAVECYLANVQPVDGTSHWSDEASDLFARLTLAKIIQAEIVGYSKADNIPCVELYVVDEHKKVQKVDAVLLERGLAKPADPTRTILLSKMFTSPAPTPAPKITLNDQSVAGVARAKRDAPTHPQQPPSPPQQQQFTQPPPSLPRDYRQKAAIWKAVNSTA